jgi:hypothetical protein
VDIEGILKQLRLRREQVEQSIITLERLQLGGGPRRGRPPKWLQEANQAEGAPKRRGRPPGSGKRAKSK